MQESDPCKKLIANY